MRNHSNSSDKLFTCVSKEAVMSLHESINFSLCVISFVFLFQFLSNLFVSISEVAIRKEKVMYFSVFSGIGYISF